LHRSDLVAQLNKPIGKALDLSLPLLAALEIPDVHNVGAHALHSHATQASARRPATINAACSMFLTIQSISSKAEGIVTDSAIISAPMGFARRLA
jgi:hypothetical protein